MYRIKGSSLYSKKREKVRYYLRSFVESTRRTHTVIVQLFNLIYTET